MTESSSAKTKPKTETQNPKLDPSLLRKFRIFTELRNHHHNLLRKSRKKSRQNRKRDRR